MKAMRIDEHGGPENIRAAESPLGELAADALRVRHAAVGVNFIDTYHRSGLYPVALPAVLGVEGAGVVEAVGAAAGNWRVGDRVVYALPSPGSYAEYRDIPAERAVAIPAGIGLETAAAVFLKGMTALYLLRRTHAVQPGEWILIHAAAGGTGLLLCQYAKSLGARVIGTVGSDEKAALARAHGCEFPVVYTREDFGARVRDLTAGRGVRAVYDGVGAATFMKSLDCLERRGLMVSFGQASGPVPPLQVTVLSAKGSLYLTRPTLFHYVAERAELASLAAELFGALAGGALSAPQVTAYGLSEAAAAHRDLESRKTRGSVILRPE